MVPADNRITYTNCKKTFQSEAQQKLEYDDHYDGGFGGGMNSSHEIELHDDGCDPTTTSSYTSITDNNVSQKVIDKTHELNLDTFDSDLEYMDKLVYSSSSDSEAMDDLVSDDFGNITSFSTNNENEMLIQSNEDDTAIQSKIETTGRMSRTLNVSVALDNSDKLQIPSSPLEKTKEIIVANEKTFEKPSDSPIVTEKSKNDEAEKIELVAIFYDSENAPQQFSTPAKNSEITFVPRSVRRNQTIFNAQTEYIYKRMGVNNPNDTTNKQKIEKMQQDTDENIELFAKKSETVAEQNYNVQSQGEVNVEIPPTHFKSDDSFLSTPVCDPNLRSQTTILRSIRRKQPHFKIDALIGHRAQRMLNFSNASSSKRKKTKKIAADNETTYKKIRKNLYSVKPKKSVYLEQCNCTPEYQCGDDCLNRVLLMECNSKCRCGNKCKNKVIQNNIVPSVECFVTNNKGLGVKACELIKSGTFIVEYVGEVINANTLKKRMKIDYKNDIHNYFLKMDRDHFIDSNRMGNLSRFVNHSCKPNSIMQRWVVDKLPRMALYAAKDIKNGEEITFNYNFSPFDDAQVCKCGEDECSGYITAQPKVRRKTALMETSMDTTFNGNFNGFNDSDIENAKKNLIDKIKKFDLEQAQSNLSVVGIDDISQIEAANDMINFKGKQLKSGVGFEAPITSGKLNICIFNIFSRQKKKKF